MTELRRDTLRGAWRAYDASGDPEVAARRDEGADGGCPLCPAGPGPAALDVGPDEVVVLDVAPQGAPAVAPTAAPAGLHHHVVPGAGASEVLLRSGDAGDGGAGGRFLDLSAERLRLLVDVWADRYAGLGQRDDVAYVHLCEADAGGVSPRGGGHGHVHGHQRVPASVIAELVAGGQHLAANGTCPTCDAVAAEQADARRVVARDDAFLTHVPFAPRSPFELHVVPLRHVPSLLELADHERTTLAGALATVGSTLRQRFGPDVPFAVSVHQAPSDDGAWLPIAHLRVEVTAFPQPQRGAGEVLLALPELGGTALCQPCTPEAAAAHLRGSPDVGAAPPA